MLLRKLRRLWRVGERTKIQSDRITTLDTEAIRHRVYGSPSTFSYFIDGVFDGLCCGILAGMTFTALMNKWKTGFFFPFTPIEE